jgi:hypothetical protein
MAGGVSRKGQGAGVRGNARAAHQRFWQGDVGGPRAESDVAKRLRRNRPIGGQGEPSPPSRATYSIADASPG